jgi:hypothetical protein
MPWLTLSLLALATAREGLPAAELPGATASVIPDLASYRQADLTPPVPVVANPQFEEGEAGWPLLAGYRIDPTGGRNGSGALRYERTDPEAYPLPFQVVRLEPGGRYRFGAWIRTEAVSAGEGISG